MSRRELAFHEAMVDVYRRAKAEAGYNATYFLQMISNPSLGGYGAANYLVNAAKPSIRYAALYDLGRLDLTIEAQCS